MVKRISRTYNKTFENNKFIVDDILLLDVRTFIFYFRDKDSDRLGH